VLAAYAADAAREVEGVHALVDGTRRHHGVRVTDEDSGVTLEVHVALEWGALGPDVGQAVQERVAEYLSRMAKLPSVIVEVVIDGIAAPASA
jgi:uncharacterized alkaline shock family protein YloU